MTGEAALPGSVGEYGWAGNAGTLFWIDPREQLIAIYMVQVSDPDRVALRNHGGLMGRWMFIGATP